jgi:hypothetical protein
MKDIRNACNDLLKKRAFKIYVLAGSIRIDLR